MGPTTLSDVMEGRAMESRRVVGPVEIGAAAHGGHCVARWDGRVIFVRHTLPGEKVMVRITDDKHDRFWRGDAVEILRPAAGRVDPPCPVAGACGGCDFQHASWAAQRVLKTDVLRELLQRFAGIDSDIYVEPVWDGRAISDAQASDDKALGWRSRMRYQIRKPDDGKTIIGLHETRSKNIIGLPAGGCLIADNRGPAVNELLTMVESAPVKADELIVATADSGTSVLAGHSALQGKDLVMQHVGDRDFQVRADGFWQPHDSAPRVLTQTVFGLLKPRSGERALDLYCGAGVFAGMLVDAGCRVTGMELDGPAIRLARTNVPQARFTAGRVDRSLPRFDGEADIVVLDPPRSGAGKQVVGQIVKLKPRAVAYVACDPAALARDVAFFAKQGYEMASIRAFDLFPMTHHMECVALLKPSEGGRSHE